MVGVCRHSATMLEFLQGKVSDRKLRLWACAYTSWYADGRSYLIDAVRAAERWADGDPHVDLGPHAQFYVCFPSAWQVAHEGAAGLRRKLGRLQSQAASHPTSRLDNLRCVFDNPRPRDLQPRMGARPQSCRWPARYARVAGLLRDADLGGRAARRGVRRPRDTGPLPAWNDVGLSFRLRCQHAVPHRRPARPRVLGSGLGARERVIGNYRHERLGKRDLTQVNALNKYPISSSCRTYRRATTFAAVTISSTNFSVRMPDCTAASRRSK